MQEWSDVRHPAALASAARGRMLDESSTTPSRPFSRRARQRADAQLYAPRRIRGARVSSRRPSHRGPSMSLRAAMVGIALVAGEMLLAPELAHDGGGGGATASATPREMAVTPPRAPAHVTASAGETALSPVDRAVAALIARLTDARRLSDRTRQTVTVVLDPATGRLWRMAGDDPDAALASDGAIPLDGRVTLTGSAARPSFTFAPDDAQSDSVWVRDGATRVAVVLDPRSGEPRAHR